MGKNIYRVQREDDKIKVKLVGWESDSGEEPVQVIEKPDLKKAKTRRPILPIVKSIFSWIATAFMAIFGVLFAIVMFIIATPFFIVLVIMNWVKVCIGLSILWIIIDLLYVGIILERKVPFEPFNNTSIIVIAVLGLIGAIVFTVAELRD